MSHEQAIVPTRTSPNKHATMPRSLDRTLGFTDLLFIVIGTVIGSGIFIVPATVLRQTGGALGPAMLVGFCPWRASSHCSAP